MYGRSSTCIYIYTKEEEFYKVVYVRVGLGLGFRVTIKKIRFFNDNVRVESEL